jgi:hypothetical protein
MNTAALNPAEIFIVAAWLTCIAIFTLDLVFSKRNTKKASKMWVILAAPAAELPELSPTAIIIFSIFFIGLVLMFWSLFTAQPDPNEDSEIELMKDFDEYQRSRRINGTPKN